MSKGFNANKRVFCNSVFDFSDSTIRKKNLFKTVFKWLKEGGVLVPIIEYAMQIK